MTKADAIDIIKSECYVFNPLNFDRSTMVNTALDMAIKALEFDLDKHDEEVIKNTVETLWGEPCEDCVSRSEVENILHNTMFDNATHDKAYRVLGLVRKQVDNLPSVQPSEDVISRGDAIDACDQSINIFDATDRIKDLPSVTPKSTRGRGHWSRKTKVDAYDIAGVKTWGIKCQCDKCDFTTIVVEDFGYYKYCPNCGCRMMESEEE